MSNLPDSAPIACSRSTECLGARCDCRAGAVVQSVPGDSGLKIAYPGTGWPLSTDPWCVTRVPLAAALPRGGLAESAV
jgi:hypothetical protein